MLLRVVHKAYHYALALPKLLHSHMQLSKISFKKRPRMIASQILVEVTGIEPATSCVQGRRSPS